MTDLDPRPHPDLVERLERHLARSGTEVSVRPASLPATVARARRRQQRRNVAVASSSVVLVLSAIAAVTVLQRPDTRPVDVDRPATSVPDTAVPIPSTVPDTVTDPTTDTTDTTDPTAYRWEVVPVAATDRPDADWPSFGNVALATDLDDPAVHVTDDGVTWTRAALEPGLLPSAAAGSTDALWALVSDERTADRQLILGVFREGTWRFRPVPVELGPDDGGGASLASVDDAVVFGFWVDDRWRAFRAAGDAPVTEVTDRIPLDPSPLHSTPQFTTSGGVVTVIDGQPPFADVGPDGLVVPSLGATMATSADGLDWSVAGRLPGLCCPVRWQDRWLARDQNGSLIQSTDGESWRAAAPEGGITPESLSAVLQYSTVVDERTVTVVASRPSPPVRLTLTENGVTMVFDQTMQTLQVVDATTGEPIGSSADDGADDLVELDMEAPPTLRVFAEDGSVRAEFTALEAGEVIAATPATASELLVLQSDDLETWTEVDLGDLVGGAPSYAQLVGVFDGRIVYWIHDRDGRITTIVGTPEG